MPISQTYIHSHNCSRQNQEITLYPNSTNGCSLVIVPVCEEVMMELELSSTDKFNTPSPPPPTPTPTSTSNDTTSEDGE